MQHEKKLEEITQICLNRLPNLWFLLNKIFDYFELLMELQSLINVRILKSGRPHIYLIFFR